MKIEFSTVESHWENTPPLRMGPCPAVAGQQKMNSSASLEVFYFIGPLSIYYVFGSSFLMTICVWTCVSRHLCVFLVLFLWLFFILLFSYSHVFFLFYFILFCSFLWNKILNGLNTFNLHPTNMDAHTYATGIIIKEKVMTLRGSGGYKRSWRKKSVEWKLGKYRKFLQIIKKINV